MKLQIIRPLRIATLSCFLLLLLLCSFSPTPSLTPQPPDSLGSGSKVIARWTSLILRHGAIRIRCQKLEGRFQPLPPFPPFRSHGLHAVGGKGMRWGQEVEPGSWVTVKGRRQTVTSIYTLNILSTYLYPKRMTQPVARLRFQIPIGTDAVLGLGMAQHYKIIAERCAQHFGNNNDISAGSKKLDLHPDLFMYSGTIKHNEYTCYMIITDEGVPVHQSSKVSRV